VADYLTRVGNGWLKARNIEPEGKAEPDPPAVERFAPGIGTGSCCSPSSVLPVENYYFIDSIYDDFDLTSETYGLHHRFDHAWMPQASAPARGESKQAKPAQP
jgi:hypothetical protein